MGSGTRSNLMKLLLFLLTTLSLFAQEQLPTNFDITPNAAKEADFRSLNPDLKHRPNYIAGQAVAIKLSPDKKRLLILTSGFNRVHNNDGTLDINASNEYVFIYDLKHGIPVKKQVIQLANTFYGIEWHPYRDAFFVSGGVDDKILYFEISQGVYLKEKEISLGHKTGLGIAVKPMASEITINESGTLLAVSNMENDSVSLIDIKSFKVIDEIDLRPGKNNPKQRGVAGGEFPFGISFVDEKIYVASMRDYEVLVLTCKDKVLRLHSRIVVGSQPTRMLYNKEDNELFVLNSRSDSVSVIDTKSESIKGEFFTIAPEHLFNQYHLKGANPNALRLLGDNLYVTNGGTNSVARIELTRSKKNIEGKVTALYPTGWYPNDLEITKSHLYVVNGKSLSGSNRGDCRDTLSTKPDALAKCTGRNQYTFKTKKAGFLSMPLPKKEEQKKLTLQVAKNNHLIQDKSSSEMIEFLRTKIKHIVYVVKENRSYDQVLGDLKIGNGDKNLTLFPEVITPNHHALARNFVTLDNFLDSGSASNDGWVWTTSGHSTEYTEKNIMINYAKRGLSYDNEGQNRNIPLAYADINERQEHDPRVPDDEDLLPGIRDVAAVDGDDEAPAEGYIWNKALEAGLSVRNYGFYCDEERYFLDKNETGYIAPSEHPFKDKIIQAYPNKPALLDITDPYFHGYDMNYPDLWRYREFKREFKEYVKKREFPNLVLVRFPHDHFGSFNTALAGVNTPLTQMADNDYALGLLVENIANSPFKDSTLIIVIEDDAQDGADHVSSHRSLCLVAGAYVKKKAVISKRYTTVNVLKTIEEILNIKPIGLNDALSESMIELFDKNEYGFSYEAKLPHILYKTDLSLPQAPKKLNLTKEHNNSYWVDVMKGQNFESEDQLDSTAFNQALWKGLKGTELPEKHLK